MDRRSFLTQSAITVSGALLANRITAQNALAQECRSGRLPGVQLYSVRNLMPQDTRGTLRALGKLGIRAVEVDGIGNSQDPTADLFGLQPEAFRAAVDEAGLGMPFASIGGDWSNAALIGDVVSEFGVETVVLTMPEMFREIRDGQFNAIGAKSLGQLDRLADRLNRAGDDYRERGIRFGYHNHHVEFIPVEGELPFEYLMERTDPELVKLELDTGWLAAANRDPVEYLRRYSSRVIACHMKDFDRSVLDAAETPDLPTLRNGFAEPGAGTIDFEAVLQVMNDINVQHEFIEIPLSNDPLSAIDRGNRYLRQLGNC